MRTEGGSAGASAVAEAFAAIASAVEERQSEAVMRAVLARAGRLCQEAAAHAPPSEAKAVLANIQQAAETWHRVWPRLGRAPEFRQAVAREARLWSRRVEELAARSSPVDHGAVA